MPTWVKQQDICIVNSESNEEIGRFQISIRPCGVRKIWPFKAFPFVTGHQPRFRVNVIKLTSSRRDFAVYLSRKYIPKDEAHLVLMDDIKIEGDRYKAKFCDGVLTTSGQYKYILSVQSSVHNKDLEILSFDAISQEHVFVDVFLPIGLSVIVSLIVSLLVSFLLSC